MIRLGGGNLTIPPLIQPPPPGSSGFIDDLGVTQWIDDNGIHSSNFIDDNGITG